MATLVYTDASGADRSFGLGAEPVTVGRAQECTIRSEDPRVSRMHARFLFDQGMLWVEDLGSANGTFIRGQKIQEYELRDGDEIVIVKDRLVYRIPKDADASSKADAMADVGKKTMYIDSAGVGQARGSRPGTAGIGVRSGTASATACRPGQRVPAL